MASPSGTSSGGTSSLQSCDDTALLLMDQRKRKRMISNRESARRSRMRKQKHLDDLMTHLNQLRAENNQIITNINVVNELNANVVSENSVLRVQVSELNHRLKALNDIISFRTNTKINTSIIAADFETDYDQMIGGGHEFFNSWNLFHGVNQPIMGCADAFMG